MSLTQSDLILDAAGPQMSGVQHSGSRLNGLQLTEDGCIPLTVGASSLSPISAPPPSEPSIPAASSSVESEMKTRGRRVRNPTQWRRAQRKLSRVAGKQYLGTHGRLVAPRQIGPDCRCSIKCYTRVDAETRQAMFSGFYALTSYDEQNAYLYGLIVKKDVSVKRKSKSTSERRVCHYEYFARDRGRLIQICKTAFANIHGISFKKIRTLCQKLDMNVLFPRDQRGKHDNRPSKITDQMKEGVRRHINSILQPPISRRFIRSSASGEFCLNLAKMHEDYRQRHPTTADPVSDGVCETDKPVKMWIYSKIFNAEFRLNVQVSFLECAADGSAPSGQQQNHQRSNAKKRARVAGLMAPSAMVAVAPSHQQPPSDTLLAPPPAPPPLPPSHLQQSDGGKLVMSQLQLLEPSPVTPAAQQLVCLPLGCAVELQAQPLDLHQHQHQHVYAVHQHHQHYQLTLDVSSAAQPLAEWALDPGH